jgi:hypothetical protein
MTACRISDRLAALALTYTSFAHLQGEVPRMPAITGGRRSKDVKIARGKDERVEDLGDE